MTPTIDKRAANQPRSLRPHNIIILILAATMIVAGLILYFRNERVEVKRMWFVNEGSDVSALKFSSDGRYLICLHYQGPPTMRDVETGGPVGRFPLNYVDFPLSFGSSFATDGIQALQNIPVAGNISECVLTDVKSGKVLRRWPGELVYATPDLSLAIIENNAHFGQHTRERIRATAGQAVNVSSGQVLGQLETDLLERVRFSKDEHYLCVPCVDGPSHLFRVPQMTDVLPLPRLFDMSISPSGDRLIGLTRDGTLQFWELPSGRHSSVKTGLVAAGWAFELNNGRLVIFGGDAQSGACVVQVRSGDGVRVLYSFKGIVDGFSPDDKYVAIDGGRGKQELDVYDAETGQSVASLGNLDAFGKSDDYSQISWGHLAMGKGIRRIAYASEDGLLSMYATASDFDPDTVTSPSPIVSADLGTKVVSFGEPESSLNDAIALPGGGVAASGGAGPKRWVEISPPGLSALNIDAEVGDSSVTRLGMSPDGKVLAGSSHTGVWTLDRATGRTTVSHLTSSEKSTASYPTETEGRPIWRDGLNKPFTVVTGLVPIGDDIYTKGPIVSSQWSSNARFIGARRLFPVKRVVGNHVYGVRYAEPSPDGKQLIVIWSDILPYVPGSHLKFELGHTLVELRDARNGTAIRTMTMKRPDGSSGDFSPGLTWAIYSTDGKRIAFEDGWKEVWIYNVETGLVTGDICGLWSQDPQFSTSKLPRHSAIAFSPDDRFLVVGRNDGAIYLYSLQTYLPIAQIGVMPDLLPVPMGDHATPAAFGWVSFDPGGQKVYGSAVNGVNIYAWNVPKMSP